MNIFKKFTAIIFFIISSCSGLAWFDSPDLVEPPDEAHLGYHSDVIIFTWTDTGSDSYVIEIGVDSDFSISTGEIPCNSNYFDLMDLIPQEIWKDLHLTLYWRVMAIGSMGIRSDWSETRTLYKTSFFDPVIVSPANEARFGSENQFPVFEWQKQTSAEYYSIEFAWDSDFSDSLGIASVYSTILDLSSVPPAQWNPIVGKFYWRVCANDSENRPGPWSVGRVFYKSTLSSLDLFQPPASSHFEPQSSPPVFRWETNEAAHHYQMRFSTDPTGEDVIGYLDSESSQFDMGNFLSQQDWWFSFASFYWAVSMIDEDGFPGPWSENRELVKIGYHRISVFGDSISYGECYPNGYLDILANRLKGRWGNLTTINQSEPGTKSGWGSQYLQTALKVSNPEYILILFGANDSVDPYGCDPHFECRVPEHLEEMVTIARAYGTIPIISTILPMNPEEKFSGAQPTVDWYNEEIRSMSIRISAPLADLNDMFWDYGDDISPLFCDWGHPSLSGYEIMADGFYQGIIAHGG